MIILGGGLAGMTAAHTVVQAGGRVLVIDKSPFLGGNSTKATSGINAAGTRSQVSGLLCMFPVPACICTSGLWVRGS